MNNAHELFSKFGQSIWLDCFDRNLLDSGGLGIPILDGVRGVISNPAAYAKAIADTNIYDSAILDFVQADTAIDGETLYLWLMTKDARMAADMLRPVFDSSGGQGGFVCVDLPARVAYDTKGTIDAARHWWQRIDRRNLMIKLPATKQGLLALETLVAENINVNITDVYCVDDYKSVVQGYLRALAMNPAPESVRSVASFGVDRLDAKVNRALDALDIGEVQFLKNKAAVSTARIAYQYYKQIVDTEEFYAQQKRGAHMQRLLWVIDTGDITGRDSAGLIYLEQLIGADTIALLKPDTFDKFLLSGRLLHSLDGDTESAQRIVQAVDSLEISLPAIAPQLREQSVRNLGDAQHAIFNALEDKIVQVTKEYA
jgi:transaldolase